MSARIPPHAPHDEFHPGESARARVLWLVLGVVLICSGHDLYEWVKAKAQPPRDGISARLAGPWVDPKMAASLVIFPEGSPRWSLTVGEQGFELLPEFEDDMGTVMGKAVCAAGGHIVGSWRLAPGPRQPNRLVLTLALIGLEPQQFNLRRAE
jgi:hypothetical protein